MRTGVWTGVKVSLKANITVKIPGIQAFGRGFRMWLAMVAALGLLQSAVWAQAPDPEFGSLQERLVRDGFDPRWISEVYRRPGVVFETGDVSRFFVYRESTLNYEQFASPASIAKARSYMQTHAADLSLAEKNFAVDKEIITAIILVETRLGTYLGKSSPLNILSTMAALADPGLRDRLWSGITDERRLTRENYLKKAAAKSRWAYGELKAFLTYAAREGLAPEAVVGSFAGAVGISQFMPSNILAHGEDGNGDGRVDLFEHADAIASIAGYLKHYGWKPGIERDDAYKVIFRYNRSKYYVNIILKIADLLKGA